MTSHCYAILLFNQNGQKQFRQDLQLTINKKIPASFALLAVPCIGLAIYLLNSYGSENEASLARKNTSHSKDAEKSGALTKPQPAITSAVTAEKLPFAAALDPSANSTWANYAAKTDLKKFFDQNLALSKTDPNAAYHLKRIMMSCVLITHDGKENAQMRLLNGTYPIDAKEARKKTFERLWTQCAGFGATPTETLSALAAELEDDGKKLGSPQFAAEKLGAERATGKENPDFNKRAVALLETNDTTVLWQLANVASANQALKTIAGDIGEVSNETVSEAWAMAACDAGYDCRGQMAPFYCMTRGICNSAGYSDIVQTAVLSPTDFAIANQIKVKISEALRKQNWTALGFGDKK